MNIVDERKWSFFRMLRTKNAQNEQIKEKIMKKERRLMDEIKYHYYAYA